MKKYYTVVQEQGNGRKGCPNTQSMWDVVRNVEWALNRVMDSNRGMSFDTLEEMSCFIASAVVSNLGVSTMKDPGPESV